MTTNPKHEPEDAKERAEFEAWFSAMEWSRETHYRKYDDGEYLDTEVTFAWRVWQARADTNKRKAEVMREMVDSGKMEEFLFHALKLRYRENNIDAASAAKYLTEQLAGLSRARAEVL